MFKKNVGQYLIMKICQIAPYGGEKTWQKLGLKEIPNTEWLILLANRPDEGEIVHIDEAYGFRKALEMEQADYPQEYKIRVDVLDLTDIGSSYYQILGYFKELFQILIKKGYQIYINGTSGLQIWRIVLYQVALMNKEHVGAYFIFNKKEMKRENIWLQTELNKNEKVILSILKGENELSLTDLTDKFFEIMKKGKLSYTVKIVQRLSMAGLIEEEKQGRTRFVKLNEIGKAYISSNIWNKKIINELDK